MTPLIKYLEKLGLSEIEARLYLALLKQGPKKVKEAADLVGLKRTTAYFHIDSLISKGLVAEVIKGSSKMITATPADRIEYLVEKKLETAVSLKNTYPQILKNLNTIEAKYANTKEPEIKYLKGLANARAIYDEAFKGREIRSFVKLEEKSVLSADNPELFKGALQKNKNLNIWEIVYESPFSRRPSVNTLSQNRGYNYKFMPPDLKWSITSEDIVIFEGKVAIINYTGKVSIVVLQSPDFYNNFKEIFDFIWRIIPDPKT